MTSIIAIANQKGGVAKTTTSLSLAGALVLQGFEILMVDMDPQGDLTLGLGIHPGQVRHSITDVLMNAANPISVSRETSIPGLDLIPSNKDLEYSERFLPLRQSYQYLLRDALKTHLSKTHYDYIILDCPPSIGAVTTNALTAAELLIIPTQPEYFSVYALRNMIAMVNRIRNSSNENLQYRILITMKDRRNRIHRQLTEQLLNTFGNNLFETIIETDTKLRESSVVGLPITHYASKSRSSFQYQTLVQELLVNVQAGIQQPA
jgi:chromosome partitioning protein